MRVLVTGGTGVLGKEVVGELRRRDHEVRILSRHGGGGDTVQGELSRGAGLATALEGYETVVHLATNPMKHKQVDVEGTRHLVDAARMTGVEHLLYISIVGIDAIPYSYYRSKLQAELIIERSGTPSTVQRATQFHDFVFRAAEALSRVPFVLVPRRVRVQPVDVRDVAARLADLVAAGPAGRVADFGGPDIFSASDLAQMVIDALGRQRRRIVPVQLPGATMRALASGANLTPSHDEGRHGFSEYLRERVHRDAGGAVRVDLPYRRR